MRMGFALLSALKALLIKYCVFSEGTSDPG